MRKPIKPEAGVFQPRLFLAFTLCSFALLLAAVGLATPTPVADTLSTSHRNISYTDPNGAPPNPTPIATGNPNCGPTNAACSVFTLTIDPSVGLAAAGYDPTQYQIAVQWQWDVSTVDYDWFIKNSAGNVVARNQSTADPSSIILPTTTPAGVYKLIGTLSTGAPIPYTGTVTLQRKSDGTSGICTPPTNCAPPRYREHEARAGQAADAGEPSLGIDWNPNVASLKHDLVNTGGVAFFTSGAHEWRVNFDDCSSPAIYNWENVSALTTQQFVLSDPIGFVDHYTSQQLGVSYPPPQTPGRVFSLDLIGGQGDSLGSYSDDDGGTYLPGGNGGAGAGPDHETLGGGPYAPPIPPGKLPGSYPNAIYYCSQNIVAEAQCSRSDDGGQTFGPSVPIFTPTQCTGGIHGHVKVAPDGTVYVPNSSCGTIGTAGVAVSTDNGITWTENNIFNSTSTQDPSVGIGQNNVGKPGTNLSGTNTIYLGYVDGDGHAKVAVSGQRGTDWSNSTVRIVDVGAPMGVTHAVFPSVVAGDDNRASFAFLGTGDGISTNTSPCDPYGATLNCKNIWHLYIATTYDGGQNWVTIDATPEDPVQTGTVCLQGTTCAGGRNLLDFMDFAIDSQGRGLVGFADGCVNCSNTFQGQSSAARGDISRQSGGRRLFAFFDPVEPAAPAAPQLVSAVLQATGGALVTWLEPDNGGLPITGYKIYRGTASGAETFLAMVDASQTKYLDTMLPAGAPNVFYYVTAVNAQGEGTHCREVSLAPPGVGGGNTCNYPFLNLDGPGTAGAIPDPTGEQTIQYVNIGEPFTTCSDNSITFLMKVETLDPANTGSAVLPQNTEYQILFGVTDTNGNPQTIYVEMDTNCPGTPANPSFSYGRRDPSATGGTLDSSECTNQAPISSCPRISGSYNKDGTILIKLDTSTPITFSAPTGATGSAFTWDARRPGTKLTSVTGDVVVFAGCGAGFLETASTTSGGTYTRAGNASCQNAPPVAMLTATPLQGHAPLTVNFDATASHEPNGACGTIDTYTIDFGDGTSATNNTGMFSHTYTSDGEYPARLVVSDSVGQASTNSAQVIISVTITTPNVIGTVSRKTHAGVGDFDVILPATGTPATEPRSGGPQGNHTIIIGFENTLASVGSVTATAQLQGGSQPVTVASSNIGTDAHQYIVNLSGVPNASIVTVTLNNATDSSGMSGNIAVKMGALIGDTNADGTTNAADATQVRNRSGQSIDSSTFRTDINLDGVTNSADATLVRSHSGTTINFTGAPEVTSRATAPAGK